MDYVEDGVIEGGKPGEVMRECALRYHVAIGNIYRWYKFYTEWGIIKAELRDRRLRLKRKYKIRRVVKRHHVNELKKIVEEHPEFYLDEFAEALLHCTHTSFSLSTIVNSS